MCGIIGYIGSKPVVPVLLDGLRRMEYRGYDSAGVALVSPEGIALRRSAGKLANLELAIREATPNTLGFINDDKIELQTRKLVYAVRRDDQAILLP